MDEKTARAVIERFNKSINEAAKEKVPFKKASSLPHTKARIKFAYFTLLEILVPEKIASKEKDDLVNSYSLLNTLVDDNTASKYLRIYKEWQTKKDSPTKSKKDERLIRQYLYFIQTLRGDDLREEINAFIAELSNNNK